MTRGRAAAVSVAAGAVLVLVGGIAVLSLRGADTTTPYDESAALEGFRAGTAAPVGPSPVPTGTPASAATAGPTASPTGTTSPSPAPAPRTAPGSAAAAPGRTAPAEREEPEGVYRYATEGHEEVDALGGARHDYPASSTITYARKGCGTEERWQPLEERVGVTQTCPGAEGAEVRSTFQQREFFGQSQSQTYTCSPGALVVPDDPRPGRTWAATCRSDDSELALSGRVVALEELVVGGTRVPVVHVTLRGTLTGSTRGASHRELWIARSGGLLVQAEADTDTAADTAGGTVRYRETYRLRLTSLTPSR